MLLYAAIRLDAAQDEFQWLSYANALWLCSWLTLRCMYVVCTYSQNFLTVLDWLNVWACSLRSTFDNHEAHTHTHRTYFSISCKTNEVSQLNRTKFDNQNIFMEYFVIWKILWQKSWTTCVRMLVKEKHRRRDSLSETTIETTSKRKCEQNHK